MSKVCLNCDIVFPAHDGLMCSICGGDGDEVVDVIAETEGGPLIPEKVGPTPEPDVLERLKAEVKLRAGLLTSSTDYLLADAIVEIEERQRKQNAMADCIYNQSKEIAQLRAITEAEPVELLREVDAALTKAWDARELPASVISGDLVRRIRALAVAPKGDTEDVE